MNQIIHTYMYVLYHRMDRYHLISSSSFSSSSALSWSLRCVFVLSKTTYSISGKEMDACRNESITHGNLTEITLKLKIVYTILFTYDNIMFSRGINDVWCRGSRVVVLVAIISNYNKNRIFSFNRA